jgi:DNA-binding transcriptional regulator/RsmH inhibitor MraZ
MKRDACPFPQEFAGKSTEMSLILTKGAEKCLWLYLPEEWDRVSEQLISAHPYSPSILKMS